MKQAIQVNLFALIVIGIVAVLLALLFLKPAFKYLKPILKNLGKREYRNGFRPFSPNWITIWGLLFTFAGMICYLIWDQWWGIALGAFGATLDKLDGKMAYAMGETLAPPKKWRTDDERNAYAIVTGENSNREVKIPNSTVWGSLFWFELNFPGGTELGVVLDPFADKLKSATILVYFGWFTGILSPWLVGLMIAPEVLGTLMRRPFTFLRKWLYKERATIIGKLKALTQWLVVVLCLPFDMGYCGKGSLCHILLLAPNVILVLACLFAVVSVLSRFAATQKYKWLRNILATFGKYADHE